MTMSIKHHGGYDVISVLSKPDSSKMTPQAYARALEKNRKAAAGKPWARTK